jgi:hypothetical protein
MAFPVAATSGAPTLTGFTPNLGAAGTAVSVTGTNLEPYAPANKLLLNASLAAVSAATATSLSTTVPANTGSGRFTVTTPNGTGTSAADFFIPPAGYTAPQVTVTGRLTLGQGQAVTPVPGKIALLVFDGTAGQRISITSSSSDGDGVVYRPNGSLLASWNFPNLLLDATVLPVSGTYTILAENLNTSTVTLTVYDVPADVTAPITPGGPAVPVTISTPGQNAHLLFTGALNQVISLVLGAPGFTGGLLELRQPPAGTPLVTLNPWGVLLPGFPPEQGFLERTVLPLAGEYTIDLNPYSSNTGTVTSTLYTFVDVTGTLTINGASVLVDITVPGQNARLSFAGTASQPLSLVVTGASGRPITFRVFNPDGSLHDTRFIQGHIDITLGLTPLAQTGPHTLEVDYSGPATGTVTVGLTSP